MRVVNGPVLDSRLRRILDLAGHRNGKEGWGRGHVRIVASGDGKAEKVELVHKV